MHPSRLLKSYLGRRTNDAAAQVAFVESLMSPDMCDRAIALAENSLKLEGKTGPSEKPMKAGTRPYALSGHRRNPPGFSISWKMH